MNMANFKIMILISLFASNTVEEIGYNGDRNLVPDKLTIIMKLVPCLIERRHFETSLCAGVCVNGVNYVVHGEEIFYGLGPTPKHH